MAITPSEEIEFDEDHLDPIEAVMAELRAARSGWVNLVPQIEEGHQPESRNPVVSIFTARGPMAPMATWSAPEAAGRRASLGIEHASGPKALARLTEADLGLRPGWLKAADHPKRGLVVTSPGDAEPADELWWLLAATHVLSPAPLTGNWLARVYRR